MLPDDCQGCLRREIAVEPIEGGPTLIVQTHFTNTDSDCFNEYLVEREAELVPLYTMEMARQVPKSCCVESPGHEGPHRVPDLDECPDE